MAFPVDEQNNRLGQELATINGVTYCSVNADLPPQPSEITVEVVDVTQAVKDEISAASPQVRLINEQVKQMIANQYSIENEIKLLRTAPSEEFDVYNAFVEDCRDWGRTQKALLGL